MISYIGILVYFLFAFIRPHDWIWVSLSTAPVDYVIFVVIIIAGYGRLISTIPTIIRFWPFKFICLYFLCILLSNVVNWDIDNMLIQTPIFFKLILLYIFIIAFVDSFNKVKILILCISIMIGLIAYQGFYQIEHGVGWAGQTLSWRGGTRWIGNYDGANSLCVLFAFITPLLMCFVFGQWGVPLKIYGALVGGIVIYNVILTESRGGFVALIVILFLIIKDKFKSKVGIILAVLLVLGIAGAILPSRLDTFDFSDETAKGRIKMWEKGIEMIRWHNPLFGVGYGNFKEYSYRLQGHNVFVQNMGEMGLIGLFAWVGMFYSFIKSWLTLKPTITDPREKSLFNAIFISLVGFLSSGFFLTLAKSDIPIILFALITIFIFQKKKDVIFTKKDIRNIVIIVITGIIAIYLIIQVYNKMFL